MDASGISLAWRWGMHRSAIRRTDLCSALKGFQPIAKVRVQNRRVLPVRHRRDRAPAEGLGGRASHDRPADRPQTEWLRPSFEKHGRSPGANPASTMEGLLSSRPVPQLPCARPSSGGCQKSDVAIVFRSTSKRVLLCGCVNAGLSGGQDPTFFRLLVDFARERSIQPV